MSRSSPRSTCRRHGLRKHFVVFPPGKTPSKIRRLHDAVPENFLLLSRSNKTGLFKSHRPVFTLAIQEHSGAFTSAASRGSTDRRIPSSATKYSPSSCSSSSFVDEARPRSASRCPRLCGLLPLDAKASTPPHKSDWTVSAHCHCRLRCPLCCASADSRRSSHSPLVMWRFLRTAHAPPETSIRPTAAPPYTCGRPWPLRLHAACGSACGQGGTITFRSCTQLGELYCQMLSLRSRDAALETSRSTVCVAAAGAATV